MSRVRCRACHYSSEWTVEASSEWISSYPASRRWQQQSREGRNSKAAAVVFISADPCPDRAIRASGRQPITGRRVGLAIARPTTAPGCSGSGPTVTHALPAQYARPRPTVSTLASTPLTQSATKSNRDKQALLITYQQVPD